MGVDDKLEFLMMKTIFGVLMKEYKSDRDTKKVG